MGRLFAGTKWDRPPTCDRCGYLESECVCPPVVAPRKVIPPEQQTARIRVEKRPKGKVVTTVSGLDPEANDLAAMLQQMKGKCGVGGTLKESVIELQGEQRAKVEQWLTALGFRVA